MQPPCESFATEGQVGPPLDARLWCPLRPQMVKSGPGQVPGRTPLAATRLGLAEVAVSGSADFGLSAGPAQVI